MAQLKETNDIVYKIIGACMEVHRIVGPGYPVEFYKRALEIEFKEKDLTIENDKSFEIIYKDVLIGNYVIDFWVNDKVIVVVRSQEDLSDGEIQQVLRGLGLADTKIGLLVNFGQAKMQYRRIVPSRQTRDAKEGRKENKRHVNYKPMGRTRETNPLY